LGCEGRKKPIRRHVSTSSFKLGKTRSAAGHARRTQPTEAWHRGQALTTLLLAAELIQPAFAGTPAECSNRALW